MTHAGQRVVQVTVNRALLNEIEAQPRIGPAPHANAA
jgi:hypothetical protein